jgi:hypothetical protein
MRVYVFGDEAGNFDFRIGRGGASRYYILGTLTSRDVAVGEKLLDLRRELAWQGIALESSFHATEDTQIVRDAVFAVLQNEGFRFDVTIFDKSKTQIRMQKDKERFYKTLWHIHFKFIAPKIVTANDELLVVAASIGEKKRRRAIRVGIEDVVSQSTRCDWRVAFWPAASDPCLQAVDYCTWAVQRKYEMSDERSYALIKPKIASEFGPI